MPYKARRHQPKHVGYTSKQHIPTHKTRPTASKRGYGYHWQRLRRMVLARQPLCQDPFGTHAHHHELVPATEVDHITPLAAGGGNSLENLQGLCKSCHSRKTRQENGPGVGGMQSL